MARPKTNHTPTRQETITGLTFPAVLLYYAVYYFIQTILIKIFIDLRPLAIFNVQKLKEEAFSRFWLVVSAQPNPPPTVDELVGSAALVPPLLAQVEGDALEIGPGTGAQLRYLTPSLIKTYHLAEPATGLHAALALNASAAGLAPDTQFRILPCGAAPESLLPALDKAGLLNSEGRPGARGDGAFDTIVCVRVLCSVPDQAGVVRVLRGLLRPGGKLVVVEHVRNPWRGPWGSRVGRVMQRVYMGLGWSWFVGDCDLGRETERVVMGVGEWEGSLELSQWWSCLPYVSGVLRKVGDV